MNEDIKWVKEQIEDSSRVIHETGIECAEEILSVSKIIIESLEKNGKVFWCGNGGSAGQAQHLSAELICGLRTHDRPALASISLTTDTSLITAWSNDVGYDSIFARQIEGLGTKGDVLIALSTSGNSKNVIEALKVAKSIGVYSVGLTGDRESKMNGLCDSLISIPSRDTQRIQEGHILVGHTICEIIENRFRQ